MRDRAIIRLYWERDERAIEETRSKYGRYCSAIAYRVVGRSDTADECVNDTYLAAWNAIPPTMPKLLSAFLAKICRNLSLKRYRADHALKRGGNEVKSSLDELGEVCASSDTVWESLEAAELARFIDAFLAQLPAEQRVMFVRRYFCFESVAEIAASSGFSESKVKMSLKRTRDKLAERLNEEGLS